MGANFVRSHYPQPQALYAACDREGVMSWVKIPIMQKIAHTAAYARNTRRMVREMVLQNCNHPSVIIWGYMCEVLGDMDWYWPEPRDPEKVAENMRKTREFVLDLEGYVRELDPFRLTANDHHSSPTPEWYVEAGLTGVSTFEGWFDYAGWYSRSLQQVGEVIDLTRALNPDWPYLLAEYGAGSDPRIHTHEPTVQDFSSEYQVLFHRTCLREVAERDWVAGAFIWTLFDFQVKERPDTMPHFNNKGVLRADRRPKDVYHLYRAHWSKEPMVHVATTDWTERTVVPDPDGTFQAPLRVFSNLDEVELHHNGQSLGAKPLRNGEASWQVRFVEGANRLEAVARGEGNCVRDLAQVHYQFIPRDLRSAPLPGDRLCVNVGQSRTYFRDPVTGNCWVPDRAYRRSGFGHVDGEYYRTWTGTPCWDGVREGVHYSILGTRLDPVYQTFLVGLTDYRFDVGDGCYDVSLYFTEPFPGERRRDPAEETGADERGRRVFDVEINGRTCMTGLDLAAQYGDRRPVVETFRVDLYDGEGIRIRLVPRVGQPVLSGAMLRQVR
jgi:beta-galactosidase